MDGTQWRAQEAVQRLAGKRVEARVEVHPGGQRSVQSSACKMLRGLHAVLLIGGQRGRHEVHDVRIAHVLGVHTQLVRMKLSPGVGQMMRKASST